MEIKIKWMPQPRQLTFLRACGLAHPFDGGTPKPPAADVIGYGGAAGGGKSDSLLAIAIIVTLSFPGCKVGYFRREYPQLEGPGGAIMRSHELISKTWAAWNGTQRRWTMPGGGVIEFCHCKSESDVFNYQSQQFDILLFDEGTQFTRFIVRYLLTRNRATISGVVPFCAIGTNPGNVGHTWFKDEFVDAGPAEQAHQVEVEEDRYETHIFIPSKLSDNQILEKRDPNYRRKLENQSEDMRRMLLDGDWDVFQGQFFTEFRRSIHVIDPFVIPHDWPRYTSKDYGLDMLANYWYAMGYQGETIVYKELHESDLIISEAAKRIKEVNNDDKIVAKYAPPDLENRRQETGKSAFDIFRENGESLIKSDNNRVAGWLAVKEWLKVFETRDEQTGKTKLDSKLKIFSNCTNLIRCLASIQRNPNNPNDCATEPHELTHGPDALRYFCIMRQRPPVITAKQAVRNWALSEEVTREPGYNSMDEPDSRYLGGW